MKSVFFVLLFVFAVGRAQAGSYTPMSWCFTPAGLAIAAVETIIVEPTIALVASNMP